MIIILIINFEWLLMIEQKIIFLSSVNIFITQLEPCTKWVYYQPSTKWIYYQSPLKGFIISPPLSGKLLTIDSVGILAALQYVGVFTPCIIIIT